MGEIILGDKNTILCPAILWQVLASGYIRRKRNKTNPEQDRWTFRFDTQRTLHGGNVIDLTLFEPFIRIH